MVEFSHLLAALLAFGASFSNACHNLFVRLGTEQRKAHHAFFVVITITTLILVPAIAVLYYPEYDVTTVSWLSFAVAGVVGTIVGMVFMYASIERIGASRTTPIVSANALIATALGVVLLDESLTLMHGVGVVLVVLGVAVIAWETHESPEDQTSTRGRSLDLLFPLVTAVAFGVEPIFANYGFAEGTSAPVGLAIKTAAAWIGFVLYLWWRDSLPTRESLGNVDSRWFVLAGVGYTLFIVGYYVGLELAPVNVVVPIVITYTLFVVVLSALFMPRRLERVTWKLLVASTVVVAGAILVTVYG